MPRSPQEHVLRQIEAEPPAQHCEPETEHSEDLKAIRNRLGQLERQLEQMRQVQELFGAVPWRNPGLRGAIAYACKKVLWKLLKPYTRAVYQLNLAILRTAEQQAEALRALAQRIEELDKSIRASRLDPHGSRPTLNRASIAAERDLAQDAVEAVSPAVCEAAQLTSLAQSQSLPFGVNLIGFLTSEKGLGEAVRSNLRICKAASVPFVANSFLDTASVNAEQLPENFSANNPYGVNLININPDYLPKAMEHNPRYRAGRYNIGYWAWELASFPREWRGAFGYLEEVWVPSSFTQQSVEGASSVPVLCVPLCIDPDAQCSPDWTRRRLGIPADVFLFLFLFDFHSFIERKNPAGLIRAFRQAFGGRKDVMLLIKCSHSLGNRLELHALKKLARGSNVRIFDQVLPRAAVHSLLSLADAYVSLHRAEGFGFPLAEAMQHGKPVIATGYSGNLEFMNQRNSCLVRFRMAEIEKTYGPYRKGDVWADPDVDHAAELMLRVAEDRKLSAEMAARGHTDVLTQLHPARIATILKTRLDEIAGIAR